MDFLLYAANLDASVATRSKISAYNSQIVSLRTWISVPLPLTKEFKMDMARFEIPVSGWTCFNTSKGASVMFEQQMRPRYESA